MIVFLPIKPKFAFALIDGRKKYEFRRARFSRTPSVVVVYASSPVQQIIGYFAVKNVREDNPKALWEEGKDAGCIAEDEYFNYFHGSETGVSIEVAEVISFRIHVRPQKIWKDFVVPQSFKYLSEQEFDEILTWASGPPLDLSTQTVRVLAL